VAPAERTPAGLRELAALFLRLGATVFGGPAAHLARFREEVVLRRGWLDERSFADLVGAASLLPGPTSTEVAIAIGRERAGIPGMLVSGGLFILPAALLVLLLAIGYTQLGELPALRWILAGVQPAVVLVIVQAVARLAPGALGGRAERLLAVGALLLAVAGVHPLAILAAAAFGLAAARGLGRGEAVAALLLPGPLPGLAAVAGVATIALLPLFLLFLGLGVVTFGSGYLLFAFLREALVLPGLIPDRVLLDAIAVGQITPGPLFSTATFLGYLLAGIPGAIVATVGIFLPAFVLVGLAHPLLPRIRASRRLGTLLDGVNAATIGLLAAVSVELARSAITGLATAAIAAGAALLLGSGRVGPTGVLALGALAGLVLGAAGLLVPA